MSDYYQKALRQDPFSVFKLSLKLSVKVRLILSISAQPFKDIKLSLKDQ